jgi:hypothetical protein
LTGFRIRSQEAQANDLAVQEVTAITAAFFGSYRMVGYNPRNALDGGDSETEP